MTVGSPATSTRSSSLTNSSEPGLRDPHREGPVARSIESHTAAMPSDLFLWAAGASILASLTLKVMGRRNDALFVGQWAPTFLVLGTYNKIVKTLGHDQST